MILTFTSISCTHLGQRSPKSGYYHWDEPTYYNEFETKESMERKKVLSELGLNKVAALSETQNQALQWRLKLKKMEKQLKIKSEVEQYYHVKPYLRSDTQRVSFLSLDGFDARNEWLKRNKISTAEVSFSEREKKAIEASDIEVGMTAEAVKESWGEPKYVELSGNPIYQNYRWIFETQVPTVDGFATQERIVYFESGEVVGWETQ